MDKNINAYCKICGAGYHICNSCKEQLSFKSWRTVTDTIEHYKIYHIIHDYSTTGNKENAKQDLSNCDLTELDDFIPEIKHVINLIMQEEVMKPKRARTTKPSALKKAIK